MKVGQRIKRLRVANNLTQDELALRSDLTRGFISLVERDRTSISIEALAQILDVLGTTLSEFFRQLEEQKVVFTVDDRVRVDREDEEEIIELLIPGAQQHLMDPALVSIEPDKSAVDEGHEGEEFGMVLEGRVILEIEGSGTYRLEKGECFYFPADRPHRLFNPGRKTAKILWVVSPPMFH
ncbi:MAG: cupin domain-containing protein [bacterium]|nr:MAG: cupin domain-containing protein [bacterium]